MVLVLQQLCQGMRLSQADAWMGGLGQIAQGPGAADALRVQQGPEQSLACPGEGRALGRLTRIPVGKALPLNVEGPR